jgi:hypothetical protein
MIKASVELEKELQRWREARRQGGRPISNDRRTVRVNGQEVVVIKKPKRSAADSETGA